MREKERQRQRHTHIHTQRIQTKMQIERVIREWSGEKEQRWRKLTWSNLEYKIFRIMADTFRSSWTTTDPGRNKIKITRNALSYRQKQPFHRPYHISLHHHHHQQEPQQAKPATEREEKKRTKNRKKRRYTDATQRNGRRETKKWRSECWRECGEEEEEKGKNRTSDYYTSIATQQQQLQLSSSSLVPSVSSPARPSVRPFVLVGRT
jgi:hypothetical protein